MNNFIGITMGGYLDENNKLMSRAELNDRITSIQEENEKLRKCVEFYADKKNWKSCYGETDACIINEDKEEYESINGLYYSGGKLARQVLEEINAQENK